MKKFILISFICVVSLMFSSTAMAKPKTQPPGSKGIVLSGGVINACYQKINGQLRVVSDPSQCRPSELPISLSAPETARTVFVTSQTYAGGLIGGIAGADLQCSTLATAAELSGTYKAWISDDIMGPATTFTHSAAPYVNTHGDTIATDWIGLTSGVLLNPILYDEAGIAVAPPINVWTGTDPAGNPVVGQTCQGWTAVGITGIEGLGSSTLADWTTGLIPPPCGDLAHLYCVQQ